MLRPLVASLLVAGALPAAGAAQLPAESQALLLLRVLAYDRQVTARAGDAVTVALLVQPGDADGAARRDELALALQRASLQFTVAGLPVRWVALSAEEEGLAERLRRARASAALLVGAAADQPAPICRATRAAQVLSLAGSRAAVEGCVTVGLLLRGARTGVLVNLAAATEEGASLEPALLAMAEVLGAPARR